jgi:LTXXQ motif family protein
MNTRVGISLTTVTLVLSLAVLPVQHSALAQGAAPLSQSDQDHSAHHPGTTAEGAPTTPSAPSGPPQSGRPSMSMGMMGDMRSMMSMMRNMQTMMGAQSGMMMPDVEGRLAALKTELKITDVQAPQWNRFADALRTAAKSMNGMFEQMMQSRSAATLPTRLERHEKMLSTHLNALRTLRDAVEPLYVSFNDEQKKLADGLMIGPMGMM